MTVLKENAEFRFALIPTPSLYDARKAFDDFKYSDAASFAEKNRLAQVLEAAAQAQYYPLVKRLVIVVLQDWKASADEVNAGRPQYLNDGHLAMKEIYRSVAGVVQPGLVNQPCYITVMNALKSGVNRALRELAKEKLVSTIRPRRSQWGAVARYGWITASNSART